MLQVLTPTVTAMALPAMCAARRGHRGFRALLYSSIGSTRSRGTYLHRALSGATRYASDERAGHTLWPLAVMALTKHTQTDRGMDACVHCAPSRSDHGPRRTR